MLTLTPNESRVLGVLVEKAQTTPQQYPLSLNAVTVGAGQKNNRDPVFDLTEDEALDAIEGLITKGLARQVILAGSRVNKYRHITREALALSLGELVILTELLLRGPQSPGELRTRAARMIPPGDDSLATLESAQAILDALAARAEPMVQRLGRRPGERAERYAQLLSPGLHPIDGPVASAGGVRAEGVRADAGLVERVEKLETDVAMLKEALRGLGG